MNPIRIAAVVWCLGLLISLTGCTDETFHNIYSTEQEQQIGEQAASSIDSHEKIDTDVRDNTRVQQVAQAIFVQARTMRDDVRYQIKIIDSPEVNAFSLPGGYIYIYTGLLDKIGDDDDALAAVIGHESAHVVLKHAVKQMSDAGFKGLLVELVGVTTDNADAYNIGDVAYELEQLHYSREDEYQADKYGLLFAYNAGYDPHGMIRMFRKLEDGGEGSTGDAYAVDHPITRNRILRVEALTKILRDHDGSYPLNVDALVEKSADTTGAASGSAPTPSPLPAGPAIVSATPGAAPGKASSTQSGTKGP